MISVQNPTLCDRFIIGLIAVLASNFLKVAILAPLRKKTTKQPSKFCTCGSFGPQG